MPTPAPSASSNVRRKPYRVAELAELWDIDRSTVYRMIYAGRLRAERHGLRGGAIRIPVDAAAEYRRCADTRPNGVAVPGESEVRARAAELDEAVA